MQQTIQSLQLQFRAEWHIEVLTDYYLELGEAAAYVEQIVVPSDYITPNNTLFKARALHYASVHQKTHINAWILHLDEEAYVNVENAHKLVDHIENENFLIECKGHKPSFANGYVVYNKQDKPDSMMMIFLDITRVTDDRCKLSWSYTWFNCVFFGVKGSNWLIHSEIERKVGFDIRYNRSIGEDWCASLTFNQNSYPAKWMNTIAYEQSPFNFKDYFKQRNRWQKANYNNFWHSSSNDFKFPLPLGLYYQTICYFISPFTMLNWLIGLINLICFLLKTVAGFESVPFNLFPVLNYTWHKYFCITTVIIYWCYSQIAYYHAGIEKYGLKTYILGWFLVLTNILPTYIFVLETCTTIYFLFFVNKNSLEFKVINKDSNIDKYGLRKKLNLKHLDDDEEKIKYNLILYKDDSIKSTQEFELSTPCDKEKLLLNKDRSI